MSSDSNLPNLANITLNQLMDQMDEIVRAAIHFIDIEETLIANCEEGQRLQKLGATYDKKKSVLDNLVAILEQLCNKSDQIQADHDDLARALFRIRDLTMRGRGDSQAITIAREVSAIACTAVQNIDETPLFEEK